MRKEIYETPEIIMDKFVTEDIMDVSNSDTPITGHPLTPGSGNITDAVPFGFV